MYRDWPAFHDTPDNTTPATRHGAQQLRETPTRALVRFKAGSVEPAHHHTHGHDVFVVSGRKTVENLTTGKTYELKNGSYLYTAVSVDAVACVCGSMALYVRTSITITPPFMQQGGERHRVTYHTDTEFLICCDGNFDVTWDE